MRFLALCAALAIGGCAGTNYVRNNYEGARSVTYSPTGNPDDSYAIADKPGENRMMILSRTSGSFGSAMLAGATYGVVDLSAPGVVYRQIADTWMKSEGRSCQSVSAEKILRSAYEVRYTCAAPTTQ